MAKRRETSQTPVEGNPAHPDIASIEQTPTAPTERKLRAFAFDPLLANQIDTRGINEVILSVPWEEDLRPGPVGEYLEVIDVDPAGGCVYNPVNLNHPHLLATQGLAPSEGNPQFHQQMVYAVAMTTIRHFEHALGRWALWAPRRAVPVGGPAVGAENGERRRVRDEYVPRLRVYPHALREANAYYSPQKKALLFGYFLASTEVPGRNLPGGTVFTCLSHDVIAHETTHALLDGMHRCFIEPTNPDVLAFHEAFADIVALLQHFTFPEALQHQIARTRGTLTTENLLGQLAQQFGEATGRRGALRDALGRRNEATGAWESLKPDPAAYERTTQPHARGSILVAAVFDAFLEIYNARTADLVRIATGGSGVLPAGQLHPDLVRRLAREAAKVARHVLGMCIAALDYCPPVDITFGEYLRGLITADTELVRDDDLGYRVAMVEAFRRRGIYPRNVRSLAPDSLLWDQSDATGPQGKEAASFLDHLLQQFNGWNLLENRYASFRYGRTSRRRFRDWVLRLQEDPHWAKQLEPLTGLALSKPSGRRAWLPTDAEGYPKIKVNAVRPAQRVGPDGQLLQQLMVELMQERPGFHDAEKQEEADRGKFGREGLTSADFVFRGACTLVFDLDDVAPEKAERRKVLPRYFIRKATLSDSRLERQRQFLAAPKSSLRATYFGTARPAEPFAVLHRDID